MRQGIYWRVMPGRDKEEREPGWARKQVGHLGKKRGKGGVGKKGPGWCGSGNLGQPTGEVDARISCQGSTETESRLVVSRGWTEG